MTLKSELVRFVSRPDEVGASDVFKSDARSRVWRVQRGQGSAYVIKRFEFSVLRQVFGRLLGVHPAQRELRINRWLGRQGIPVVPIEAWGSVGGRSWLATQWWGPTLLQVARDGAGLELGSRRRVMGSVGRLIGVLVTNGVYFRDLKSSNVVVGQGDTAFLVDTGSARRSWKFRDAVRMIAMLEHTAEQDGVGRRDRLRCLRDAAAHSDRLGPWRLLPGAIRQVVVQYGARQQRDRRLAPRIDA